MTLSSDTSPPVSSAERTRRKALALGLGAPALLLLARGARAQGDTATPIVLGPTDETVTPFRLSLPQAAIDDLRDRLGTARLPETETAQGWDQGAPLEPTAALLAYWRDGYDMRRLETRLNAVPNFRTRIDGLGVHFIHVRSPHPQARALILTHGWPGSVVEFLDVIGPLTNPTAHGGTAEEAFHVVIPSLPGYGLSDKPTEAGWGLPRIARAWAVLMQRLGYDSYYAQGGDWGAGVTTWMAKQQVEGLKGIHLNLPILFPPPLVGTPDAREQAAIAQLVAYGATGSGYAVLQGTKPQTLGYALADSPAGQAAWIYEKFGLWTDSDKHPDRELGRDRILDDISLYWFTNTAASSARLYGESFATDFTPQQLALPVAVSVFPGEIFQPPRIWGERLYSRLTYWAEAPRGGHFAAFEQPEVFTSELRRAFATM